MRRRLLIAGTAVVVVVLGLVVLVWFQPQQLLIDEEVNDAAPLAAGPPSSPPTAAADPAATVSTAASGAAADVRTGAFVSRDHGTSGTVRVIRVADGSLVVRLEGLDTDNGPDLHLYLSTNPAQGPEQAFDDDFASLGRLRGNKGDQNYTVPTGVDLSRFASVVIWCDRFNSAFGAADLRPPQG